MDDTAYYGWLRVSAASQTAPGLAALAWRLRLFPASQQRDELLEICEAHSRARVPAPEPTRSG